ncbi:MAG: phosphate ABC transporter permease subunit PstC [Defluviitaleaceae bacterium]|nr:phosphate ABC transporter permease subunit PstC [Defluviitaleaceae bacterium]
MKKNSGKRKISEKISETIMSALAGIGVLAILFIFVFVFLRALPVFKESGIGLFISTGFERQVVTAYGSAEPLYSFGLLGLITGTLATTTLAIVTASLIGIGSAVVISEFAPRPLAYSLTSLVRLLASIPSVIFGLVGVIIVVPFISSLFVTTELQLQYLSRFQITGRGLLASVIVLTFMLVPTVTALSADAIAAVPKRFKEAGYAMGMTRFRVILKIILPTGRSGIIASVILAAGRGIGEAIALAMVCGGIGLVPDLSLGFVTLLAPVLPLSAAIMVNSEGAGSQSVSAALFACAAVLLLIGTVLSITARAVNSYMRKKIGDAA